MLYSYAAWVFEAQHAIEFLTKVINSLYHGLCGEVFPESFASFFGGSVFSGHKQVRQSSPAVSCVFFVQKFTEACQVRIHKPDDVKAVGYDDGVGKVLPDKASVF